MLILLKLRLVLLNEAAGIPAQTVETLHFRAKDAVSAENTFTWPITVDNMAGSNPQSAGIWPARKQYIASFLPFFVANVSVTPNIVYSTTQTNDIFSVTIANMSSDYVNQARIVIPPELSTNGIVVHRRPCEAVRRPRARVAVLREQRTAARPRRAGAPVHGGARRDRRNAPGPRARKHDSPREAIRRV